MSLSKPTTSIELEDVESGAKDVLLKMNDKRKKQKSEKVPRMKVKEFSLGVEKQTTEPSKLRFKSEAPEDESDIHES